MFSVYFESLKEYGNCTVKAFRYFVSFVDCVKNTKLIIKFKICFLNCLQTWQSTNIKTEQKYSLDISVLENAALLVCLIWSWQLEVVFLRLLARVGLWTENFCVPSKTTMMTKLRWIPVSRQIVCAINGSIKLQWFSFMLPGFKHELATILN